MKKLIISLLLVSTLTSCIVIKTTRRPKRHRQVVEVPYKAPERRYLGR